METADALQPKKVLSPRTALNIKQVLSDLQEIRNDGLGWIADSAFSEKNKSNNSQPTNVKFYKTIARIMWTE